jgi:serine/threonine protein kinase
MLEFSNIRINLEHEDYVKEMLEKRQEEIGELIEDLSKSLGEGNTANIRFLEANERLCLKIYKRPEQVPAGIFYLSPESEERFLENLEHINTKVRVPKVYASFETADGSTDGKHQFLIMEALSAVSVDDVLQGRAELPKAFDFSTFKTDLLDFVQKMHDERIYHRDLHEGNIMINKENGELYVIDFGAAGEFYGEPEPGERGPYHITIDGQTRVLTSDESMVKTVSKKLGDSLTATN